MNSVYEDGFNDYHFVIKSGSNATFSKDIAVFLVLRS